MILPAAGVPDALSEDRGLEYPAGLGLREDAGTGARQGSNRRSSALGLGPDGLPRLRQRGPESARKNLGFPRFVCSLPAPHTSRMKPTFVVGVKLGLCGQFTMRRPWPNLPRGGTSPRNNFSAFPLFLVPTIWLLIGLG